MKNKMVKIFIALVFCCFCVAANLLCEAKGSPGKAIKVEDAADLARKKTEDLLILDVRTPTEFAAGHLPNAVNIDFFGGGFEREVEKLPKDATVLLYCRSGKRSAGAMDILREAGFSNVLHMEQGFDKWRKAGLPVEK